MSGGADKINIEVLFDYKSNGAAPIKEFENSVGAVDKRVGSLNSSFGSLGPSIAGAFSVSAIMGAAAALSEAADEAAKFDKGVREIGTLMGGLSEGEIRQMKNELTALSIESGQAIDTLTKARYDIVSAGFGDAASSAMLLEQSSKLAAAGVTEVSVTADLLTTALNAYGESADAASTYSDKMFTIVKLGKTTMGELGSSMGQVLATAGPMEVSIDEVGAAMATLTTQGQSTAMAATAINSAMVELSKPSKELRAALAAVGVESDNLIKTGGGLTGALNLVKRASSETNTDVGKLLGSQEALRAVFPLVSSGAQTYADDLDKLAQSTGAADEAYQQMSESSEMLKRQAGEAFEAARRAVGDAIIESEPYRDLLSGIKGLFVGMASESEQAEVAMINAADNSERRWIAVGTAVREVFGWAAKIWDLADQGDKWIANLDANNPYQKLVARIDQSELLKKAKAGPPGNSVADETAYFYALVAQKKAAEAAAEAITEKGKAENETAGHSERATKITGGATKATNEHRDAVEDARRAQQYWTEALRAAQIELAGGTRATLTLAEADKMVSAAEIEVNRVVSLGVGHDKELTAATAELTSARRSFENLEQGLSATMADANNAMSLGEKRTLSVEAATKRHNDAVRDLNNILKEFVRVNDASGGSVQQTEADQDRLKDAVDEVSQSYREQQDAVQSAADAHEEAAGKINTAIESIAGAFESMTGTSISGLDALQGAVTAFVGGGSNSTMSGVLGVASFLGQNIGGSTGSLVTAVASMALAGLEIAGPIGAAAGAVLGGVVSLFSGDDQEKAARDDARAQVYDQMLQSALSGGAASLDLLRQAGWTYDAVRSYTGAGAIAGKRAGSRLLEDRGVEGAMALSDYLAAMDSMSQMIASVTKSSVTVTLDSIAAKYEYLIAQSGDLALAEEARFRETASAMLGITVDSMTGALETAMSAASVDEGAEVLRKNIEDSINSSLRQIVISRALETQISVLDPIISEIVTAVQSGADLADTGMLTNLASAASSIADKIVPIFAAIYAAFDNVNMLPSSAASDTAELSSTAVTPSGDLVSATSSIDGASDAMEATASALEHVTDTLNESASQLGDVAETISTQQDETALLRAEVFKLREEVQALLELQANMLTMHGQHYAKMDNLIYNGYALRTHAEVD